jgi:hypothetical protein
MLKIVSFRDQAAERAEQIKSLNFNWFDKRPASQEKITEFADLIYQRVQDQVNAVNPVNLMFDTQQGELGKRIRFKETVGGRVYTRSYGEYKKASPMKSTFFNISTTPKSLHLWWPIEDIKAGVILTSEMIDMATKAIMHYRTKLMWETLKDGILSSDATYCSTSATLSAGALTTALLSLADTCQVQAIVGRKSYLGPIITFTGYDNTTGYPDTVKDQIHNQGWLSSFAGTPVIGLETYEDELTGAVAIDAGNIFIIGSKAKKWNRWVEVTPISYASEAIPSNSTFHLYYDFEDGFAIWKPKYMRRIWDGTAANA